MKIQHKKTPEKSGNIYVNLENRRNSQIRNILKYTLQFRFHHGYMEQLKPTNLKRTIPAYCCIIIWNTTYEISKYLVKIIQPTPDKSQHKIKKTVGFVNEAKTWKISPTEIQVSYDAVNLYPSVPLDKAVDVIVEYLKHDFNNVRTRTKLTLVDIHQPIDLCVSE